ncbi:ATP-binding cassette domain-containing protein [Staphylococcus saccharolyticus]|uniref:ATP-binding cassette domain-containing protein n=1 Tax=Staphylococcus saccharolyticus TaxID=33028 RepID=UPI003D7F93C7
MYINLLRKKVLCDVNFKLLASEMVGLIGSSEAGKSTLMKLIAKTQLPSQGNVYFKNTDIDDSHNMIKDFSFMIGQMYYPELNARQNIENYLKINNKISYSSEIQTMLNIVGLEDNDKKVKNSSYGMKQRDSV